MLVKITWFYGILVGFSCVSRKIELLFFVFEFYHKGQKFCSTEFLVCGKIMKFFL